MFTVRRTIRAVNENIEYAKAHSGRNGWSIGKLFKHSIMSVAVTCTYEASFIDEKDYEQNIEAFNENFRQDLLSAGFSKEYIENNSNGIVLPKENVEVEVENPMTWREWHNNRNK